MENTQSLQRVMLTETGLPVPLNSLTAATPLQQDILKVLAYFDIFRHPLTAEEIYTFLPSNSTSPDAVSSACRTTPLKENIHHHNGYFHLAGEDSAVVYERLAKEERAKHHWKIASLMASIMRHFPFVRGVFISGELSKGVASENGDVDFVVVAENNRLWICRSLLIAFKKIALLNKKKYFCLNHLMTSRNFTVNERSIYTAIEVATLRPLFNHELFESYQLANSWTRQFLPNFEVPNPHTLRAARSFPQVVVEAFFFKAFADWLDTRLMEFWKTTWKKRYAHLTEEKRNTIFHCSRDLSTAYNGDFSSTILSSYYKRLAQLGLHD